MKLLLGPALYANEAKTSPETWGFFVNLFLDSPDATTPPPLRLCFTDARGTEVFASAEVKPVADLSWLPRDTAGVVWRWEVVLKRAKEHQRLRYHFESPDAPGKPIAFGAASAKPLVVDDVVVPALGALPTMAFFSCNGASDAKAWNSLAEPFALWDEMLRQHRDAKTSGFQLLLGGGDQLYADSLWYTVEELVRFRKLSLRQRLEEKAPKGFADRMLGEFVRLYRERWSGTQGLAPMLARVPALFTWDDHDVFDGWGSHEELQRTPWFEALYSAAARSFEVFQLGGRVRARPDEKPGARPDEEPRYRPLEDLRQQRLPDDGRGDSAAPRHYFQAARFAGTHCDLDVVLLDLRSGRTSETLPNGKVKHSVMSGAQWGAFDAWRKAHQERPEAGKKARHVVVVSSVPLVHMRYGPAAERLAGLKDLRDDLLDQWESVVHRGERTRLMMDLFALAKDSCCAVTVVSGDVHVGARALIRSCNPEHLTGNMVEATIDQVTASAIVHPPPNALQFLGMRALSQDGVEDLPSFLRTEMLPVGTDLYLRERNWLAMRLEDSKLTPPRPKLWVRWEAEESCLSMEVVVEPPPLRKA